MNEVNQIYRCNICGNMVEMVHASTGTLVCCGKPMELLKENVTEGAREKHLPVIEENGNKITVRVGEIEHPMDDAHYIEWFELVCDKCVKRVFMKPGDKPVAVFSSDCKGYSARAYCNLHGLWKNSRFANNKLLAL